VLPVAPTRSHPEGPAVVPYELLLTILSEALGSEMGARPSSTVLAGASRPR
jgi:hypothetical protein